MRGQGGSETSVAGKKRMSKRNNVIKGAREKRALVPPKGAVGKPAKESFLRPKTVKSPRIHKKERKPAEFSRPYCSVGFCGKVLLKMRKSIIVFAVL